MKNNDKLKIITDKTISKLLKENIVLPSKYFDTFQEESFSMKIYNEKDMKSEMQNFLQEEVNSINSMAEKILGNMENFVDYTKEANRALKNKNFEKISFLQSQVELLQDDILTIIDDIYHDSLTKSYNKKWIFKELLSENDLFLKDYNLIFTEIQNIDYINEEYSRTIANNVIKFIIDIINDELNKYDREYSIVRFTNDRFLIFYDINTKSFDNIIKEIQTKIAKSTLKTKSGILIKTNFLYISEPISKKQNFYKLLEDLEFKLDEVKLQKK